LSIAPSPSAASGAAWVIARSARRISDATWLACGSSMSRQKSPSSSWPAAAFGRAEADPAASDSTASPTATAQRTA
jgi:hypothetical protein